MFLCIFKFKYCIGDPAAPQSSLSECWSGWILHILWTCIQCCEPGIFAGAQRWLLKWTGSGQKMFNVQFCYLISQFLCFGGKDDQKL